MEDAEQFATAFQRFVAQYHKEEFFYLGLVDKEVLTRFWTEAIEKGNVTSVEHLFYLSVDILRVRKGQRWFAGGSASEVILKSAESWKDADDRDWYEKREGKQLQPTTYRLGFYAPFMVSLCDFISICIRGENLPDEHIEIVRGPKPLEIGYSLIEYAFAIGIPISVVKPEDSRMFRLADTSHEPIKVRTLYSLSLSQEQIRILGEKLWKAHLHT